MSSHRWLARTAAFALQMAQEASTAHSLHAYDTLAAWTPLAWQAAESGLLAYRVTKSGDAGVVRSNVGPSASPAPATTRIRLVSSRPTR